MMLLRARKFGLNPLNVVDGDIRGRDNGDRANEAGQRADDEENGRGDLSKHLRVGNTEARQEKNQSSQQNIEGALRKNVVLVEVIA